ncbi:hypothetical protein MIV100L [Invertebrate iridescent virus 3]|uniref:Uncharacterized protein 100L n=1 Tax=Invertebrate iridescent virus 3 TaxID=345201 RepID=VF378_IIV3|nr:hypothetical protein MIV100L [Invertebrate iridescent virus 3]Q196W0.1 RecName: Full=Uncharacterized protein 100L [Invertebrate iridescent virus 3]ABF82130.1 hypothetical protein MIV100L [Invertebrate iridescent virus 3]
MNDVHDCLVWVNDPYFHPISKRPIKYKGPTWRHYDKKCDLLGITGPKATKSPSRRTTRSPSPSRRTTRSSPSRRTTRSSPSRRTTRSPSPSGRRKQGGPAVYCGNNALDEGLLDGSKVVGTRYQCLQKGVAVGLNNPVLHHSPNYQPIVDAKIYCGTGSKLPASKLRFGTPTECMGKGYQIGQNKRFQQSGLQQGPYIWEEDGWYKIIVPKN